MSASRSTTHGASTTGSSSSNSASASSNAAGSSTSAASASSSSAEATKIFVRNIPYSWTHSDLERAFEHVAPIKHAFVVTTRGAKKNSQRLGDDGAVQSVTDASNAAAATPKFENRGFGFIEFATSSDARRASEEMDGFSVTAGEKTQKLAVELSMPKGEKPAPGAATATSAAKSAPPTPVSVQKTTATPPTPAAKSASSTASAHTPSAKSSTAATPAKQKLKDVKLTPATPAGVTSLSAKKPVAAVKHESDSETSEDESDDEEEKKEVKQESKQKESVKATKPTATKTTATPTPLPSATSTATSTSTPATTSSSRTILLSGINPTVKNLTPHLEGILSNISAVLFPSPESTTKYKAARLTFETETLAQAAVRALDKKLIKNDPVRAILLTNEVKANRMIIRNLPWLISEKRIHLIFKDCCKDPEQGGGGGKIVQIDLPKEADGKSKGFGFISFTNLKAAELALKKTGTIVNNRPIAVDWVLAKDDYVNRVKQNEVEEKKLVEKEEKKEQEKKKEEKEASKKKKDKVKMEDGEDDDIKVKLEDADEDVDMLDLSKDKKKNKSILDSILAKGSDSEDSDDEEEKEEKVKKEDQEEDEDESMDGSDDDEDDSDDDEDDDDSDHDDDKLNMSDESGSDADMSDAEDDDDEAAPELDQTTTPQFKHPRPSDTSRGCTIFIRNLSYDTNEQKLLDKFQQFGQVKYGKVVWDKELDRSRGTAFVQFEDAEVAKKVVGMSVDTSTNPAVLYKKNKITAAVASGQGITLDGRVLNIVLAVDREQASTLAEKNKEKQEKDKRNLYLANEGNIRADSEAAKNMPKGELEKREKSYREKKKKLKNPNYCVSRTRLSVRNLPLEVDEKVLKKVFMKAARDAVKQQPRDSPLRDGTIGQPVLVQVKLLRSQDQLDSKGEGKSKRYGFIEFDRHEHSLLALRALNNNPDAFSAAQISAKRQRPFVEFALEDARKLLLRQQKIKAAEKRKEWKEKQQKELDAANGEGEKTDATGTKTKPSKPKVKSSEQPRKKAPKPVADPTAGGGRGACFECGEGGHISKNCPKKNGTNGSATTTPTNAKSTSAASSKSTPSSTPSSSSATKTAGSKRKSADTPSSPATTPSEPLPKKNKNNKHRDINVPSHLASSSDQKEEKQFEQLVQQHKKKFFGEEDAQKIKQAASRWFD